MERDGDILAPRELLRGALNICRAIELADRDNDDHVADDCMSMLMQHLHMAKVVLVHDDLMLAGNVERAAQEILQEARDSGHVTHYLRSDEAEESQPAGGSRRGVKAPSGRAGARRRCSMPATNGMVGRRRG